MEKTSKVEKSSLIVLRRSRKRPFLASKRSIYKGIERLDDSAVIFRVIAKTDEHLKYQLIRDLNRAFKMAFDKNGIEIPFPQVVVHQPK